MRSQLTLQRIVSPALVYALAAAFSVSLTRVGSGIAMFWIATAILVPLLLAVSPRRWGPTLAACWLASVAVTSALGFGWRASPILATANIGEAAIAALLLRAAHRRFRSYTSLQWMGLAILGGGIVAPLVSGLVVVPALAWLTGQSVGAVGKDWMLSHGLGFISLFPVAGLLAQARIRHRSILPEPGKRLRSGIALILVTATGLLCFGQSTIPMLFMPILVLMYTMVLTDLTTSALAMVILLTMGVGSTYLNIGPLRLMDVPLAERFLFLQFYIGCIALTGIPIALMLDKRRTLFATLAESEARYRLLADFSTDIIMVTGDRGEIRYISPSICQLGDYDPAVLIGKNADLLIAHQHKADVTEAHRRVLRNPGTTASVEFLGVTRANGTRWFESHMRGIFREDGSSAGVCSIVRDIAKRKRRESELQAVALTDPLTSLPNRRAFDIFMSSLDKDEGEGYVAVFHLDKLDRVNDAFGPAIGDLVILAFARAARGVLRDTDLVARIGGEAFAVHVHDTSLPQTRHVCDRIRAAFAHEMQLAAPQVVAVSASVGICVRDGPIDAVLQRADAALHEARASGRDHMAIAA